ncbi:MAG: VirK/YbjX family protein [Bacteroidia bacterium]
MTDQTTNSIFSSAWHYAAVGYSNEKPKRRRKQQRKAILHTALSPVFAKRWFALLASPELNDITPSRPLLYVKPFRPYISVKWNKAQKLKVIRDTYRFLKSKGDTFRKVLSSKEGMVLAEIPFDAEYIGRLILGYDDRFRKEGELVLTLECEKLGGKIVSVAFSLEEVESGTWAALIGCVQGYNTINQTEGAFKITQKLMHGLRPNAFIIACLQELSTALHLSAIRATGNEIQTFQKKHLIHLPWAHKISFDYSNFWKENEGQEIGGGWFGLPLKAHRKDYAEIKTHKRALYRRRYEMLDDISVKIAAILK